MRTFSDIEGQQTILKALTIAGACSTIDYCEQVYRDGLKYFLMSCLQYRFNPETGVFRHCDDHPSQHRLWLSSISYESGVMTFPSPPSSSPPSLQVQF